MMRLAKEKRRCRAGRYGTEKSSGKGYYELRAGTGSSEQDDEARMLQSKRFRGAGFLRRVGIGLPDVRLLFEGGSAGRRRRLRWKYPFGEDGAIVGVAVAVVSPAGGGRRESMVWLALLLLVVVVVVVGGAAVGRRSVFQSCLGGGAEYMLVGQEQEQRR